MCPWDALKINFTGHFHENITKMHKHVTIFRVVIIGSTPGRHIGEKTRSMWGHMKLRRVLQEHGPTKEKVKAWPVVGQFSSIGSMGPSKDNWLCGEWQQSLSATKSGVGLQSTTRLQLVSHLGMHFIDELDVKPVLKTTSK